MDSSQRFCVRWNSYKTNLQTAFPKLLTSEHFVDVTLACEKQYLKCHKIVLSACSVYFEDLLVNNPCQHPIIFMKDVAFWEMKALVEFMYKGEVNVSQEQLDSLLKSAESLQIRGLSGAKPWSGEPEEEVSPKKRDPEDAKSLQITSCLDKADGAMEEDCKSTPVKSEGEVDIKDDFDESTEDLSYLGNTDDDTPTEYAPDEVFSEQPREPGTSSIADLTSLALNSVECVMDQERKLESPSASLDNLSEHNYTNACEDNMVTITKVTGLSGACQKSAVPYRPIAPKPLYSSTYSRHPMDSPQPRTVRKDVFNRIRRSEAELGKAAEMVRGGMTFQTASDTFNIPISTIRFYMARRGILPQRRRGRGSSGVRDDDLIHPPFEIIHYRLPDIDKPL